MTTDRIPRFSVAERVSHWMAALSFLYAAFTGLALWSHKLFWLASVFGGGSTVRGMHPWGGTIFAIALGVMFLRWSKRMRLDADDLVVLYGPHAALDRALALLESPPEPETLTSRA